VLRRTIAFAALSSAATFAHAASFNDGRDAHLHSGFEVGLGMGLNQLKIETEDGFELFDEQSTAWRVFGGYRLNRFIAFQVGWIDGGSAGESFGNVEYRVESRALEGSVLGILPIGERVQVFGRASQFKWKLKERLQDATTRLEAESDGSEFGWGAGAGVFVDGALVRLEYQQIDFDAGASSNLVSLNVAWVF
jgi:OOP family OmpA-OmpF porin